MRRWIAIAWHASFLVLAAVLYFLFVLPRWFELTGAWPVGLGTPLRIVCGVLIGLAALPVAFTLIHTRKPEFGTPQLALSMRFWSVALHVLAGVLIVGAAVAEIWLSLDAAGQWLFGVYGAAAAIAVLGALGFYLAYVAEQAPPPPKPLKPKKPKTRRGRGKAAAADETAETAETETAETDETAETESSDTEAAETDDADSADTEVAGEPVSLNKPADPDDQDDTADSAEPAGDTPEPEADDEASGRLRNRRPGGKRPRRFGRGRGGVAVDE
ncbi:hypothetical protein [Mycolicibacterium arenosum]|uniref:Transmembrane protein n=1 Tax=Mycolicibacterium arenosum TaxID=2952157 RepID=A0ABT1MCR2_9MYCO|nr:hypothetical protein [Mycolicibacterium sp. CAU 1645]MCP9275954.1 hypothetical protein [Mycolicibacterium sp. CAU 1645]